jgi:hypothetical protein
MLSTYELIVSPMLSAAFQSYYYILKSVIVFAGIPSDLLFDNRYTMNTDDLSTGHYSFYGYTSTRIRYDRKAMMWNMSFISDTSVSATTNATGARFI